MPDIPIMMPSMDYPDEQVMAQVSGNITAIFRAQGNYTFRRSDGAGTIERESLDLTMTLRYSLAPKSKEAVITRTIQGTKKATMEDRIESASAKGATSGSYTLPMSRVGSRGRSESGFGVVGVGVVGVVRERGVGVGPSQLIALTQKRYD
jgi:hypothetical protein